MGAMKLPSFPRSLRGRVTLAAVLLVLLGVVGPFVYLNLIRDDPPPRLTLGDATSTTLKGSRTEADQTTTSTRGLADRSSSIVPGDLDGTWEVSEGSQVGYRAKEVLFGQDAEAVGRTSAVTGTFTFAATTLQAANFTVDMTTVRSDEERRDGQFHGRIMDTATHPTATFKLTAPTTVGTLPEKGQTVEVSVSGIFTIRGVTRNVEIPLKVRNNGGTIEINGLFPVTFSDYGVPDPSFGPATVEDHGEIEFLLTFERT